MHMLTGERSLSWDAVEGPSAPPDPQNAMVLFLNPVAVTLMGLSARASGLLLLRRGIPRMVARLARVDQRLDLPPRLPRGLRRRALLVASVGAIFFVFFVTFLAVRFSQSGAVSLVFVMLLFWCNMGALVADQLFICLCHNFSERFKFLNECLDQGRVLDLSFTLRNTPLPNIILTRNQIASCSRELEKELQEARQRVVPSQPNPGWGAWSRGFPAPSNSPAWRLTGQSVAGLRQCHLELCDLSDELCHLFRFHLLTSLSGSFANVLLNLYLALYGVSLQEPVHAPAPDPLQAAGSVLTGVCYAVRFVAVLALLSAHVAAQTDAFSVLGFFSLRASLVSSAFAAGLTYMVIMVQFREA
ncbi:putative gustatory receptor 28b isoform X1 [Gryllus bimaculatus]|nr:putative gustatory receptor 28b isoform X1 [Gryllus bimaculatus]